MAKKENKMNAKEFAHELEKAASFIRQQQAEIEALKQIIDANNLNQNIGQFVKPTNEPLAWTDGRGNYFDKNSFFPVDDLIPLYTHPVKEQDESFDRTASHMAGEYVSYPVKEQDTECQYCKQGCIRCDARKQLTDEEMKDLIQEYWGDVHIVDPDGYLHEIAFIRAILRKAQEK